MPDETVDIEVTGVPQALEDLTTFVDGENYTLSNDSDAMIFIRLAADAPDADAAGHPLPPYRDYDFRFSADPEKTWVWSRDPPARLVVTTAAS